MNVIFGAVSIISAALLLIREPDAVLASFLGGGEKALY